MLVDCALLLVCELRPAVFEWCTRLSRRLASVWLGKGRVVVVDVDEGGKDEMGEARRLFIPFMYRVVATALCWGDQQNGFALRYCLLKSIVAMLPLIHKAI